MDTYLKCESDLKNVILFENLTLTDHIEDKRNRGNGELPIKQACVNGWQTSDWKI